MMMDVGADRHVYKKRRRRTLIALIVTMGAILVSGTLDMGRIQWWSCFYILHESSSFFLITHRLL